MTRISPPPINEPIVDGYGNTSLPWILFFNNLWNGDTGDDWTPTFVSMGSTGTPTYTGKIYRIGQRLAYFTITVTPATDTTSTAGTTYCDNFPMTLSSDGACLAASGFVGSETAGMCKSSSNRIYPPAWAAITVPVTIAGLVEAR